MAVSFPSMKRMTLYAARDKKGWTQAELEDRSGVKQQTISDIEAGRIVDPRISTVEALEDALGVRRGTLTFGAQERVAS